MAGKVNLDGTEITVKEIMRHEMPGRYRSKWDPLFTDVMLRLERLGIQNALRYEMPNPTDAHNARNALNKRFRATRDDVELVAVRRNGHSILFVANKPAE